MLLVANDATKLSLWVMRHVLAQMPIRYTIIWSITFKSNNWIQDLSNPFVFNFLGWSFIERVLFERIYFSFLYSLVWRSVFSKFRYVRVYPSRCHCDHSICMSSSLAFFRRVLSSKYELLIFSSHLLFMISQVSTPETSAYLNQNLKSAYLMCKVCHFPSVINIRHSFPPVNKKSLLFNINIRYIIIQSIFCF